MTGATLLDDQVLAAMEEYVPLLPAHNPPYIAAVRLFYDLLPGVPLVGLFETAFHDGIPPRAYLYSVPYEWYERFGVRRLGYHGASFRYVSGRVPELLGRPPAGNGTDHQRDPSVKRDCPLLTLQGAPLSLCSATQIGSKARDLLALPEFAGKVLAVLSDMIYLSAPDGEVFWICPERFPLHRRCILVLLLPKVVLG